MLKGTKWGRRFPFENRSQTGLKGALTATSRTLLRPPPIESRTTRERGRRRGVSTSRVWWTRARRQAEDGVPLARSPISHQTLSRRRFKYRQPIPTRSVVQTRAESDVIFGFENHAHVAHYRIVRLRTHLRSKPSSRATFCPTHAKRQSRKVARRGCPKRTAVLESESVYNPRARSHAETHVGPCLTPWRAELRRGYGGTRARPRSNRSPTRAHRALTVAA